MLTHVTRFRFFFIKPKVKTGVRYLPSSSQFSSRLLRIADPSHKITIKYINVCGFNVKTDKTVLGSVNSFTNRCCAENTRRTQIPPLPLNVFNQTI